MMKCDKCPLQYTEVHGEYLPDEGCILFGEEMNSPFLYTDKDGKDGCYIDRHFIEQVAKKINKRN